MNTAAAFSSSARASGRSSMYGRTRWRKRTRSCFGTATSRRLRRRTDRICRSVRRLRDRMVRFPSTKPDRVEGALRGAADVGLLVLQGAIEIFNEFIGADLAHRPCGGPAEGRALVFNHPFHEFIDPRFAQTVKADQGIADDAVIFVPQAGPEFAARRRGLDSPQSLDGTGA